MPTPKIKEVLKRIDSGIENFVKDLPDSEKKIYDKVLSIVKQLELDTLGNVTNNVNNLKLVNREKKWIRFVNGTTMMLTELFIIKKQLKHAYSYHLLVILLL